MCCISTAIKNKRVLIREAEFKKKCEDYAKMCDMPSKYVNELKIMERTANS